MEKKRRHESHKLYRGKLRVVGGQSLLPKRIEAAMTADQLRANQLRAKLEAACQDLWWSSESDYPVEAVWRSPNTAVTNTANTDTDEPIAIPIVRQLFNYANEIEIRLVEVEDFFERATTPKSWHTPADKDQLSRLRQLKTLLTSALSRLQVYRCGNVEISVYVLGYTPDKTIAGVKTLLIET